MADRTDYALAGLQSRAIPRDMPNGRGFLLPAVTCCRRRCSRSTARARPRTRRCATRRGTAPRPSAAPVPGGPAARAIIDRAGPRPTRCTARLLVGVGGDDLSQVRVETPGLLVLGPSGLRSQHRAGRPGGLTGPRRDAAAFWSPRAVRPSPAPRPRPAPPHQQRRDRDGQAQCRAAGAAVAIVVDDAELLTDTPLGNELTACYRRIRDSGHRLLAAAVADGSFGLRGLIPEPARTKCGLVLAPASTTDCSVLGAWLPASVFALGVLLRGALVHHGRITAVAGPCVAGWLRERDPAGSQPGSCGSRGRAWRSRSVAGTSCRRPSAAAPWARCSPGASGHRASRWPSRYSGPSSCPTRRSWPGSCRNARS